MWVLNLNNATLKWFVSPESVPGGYAIFSHVWDKEEQSFQEIQTVGRQCTRAGSNPRDYVGEKIRQFCIAAERDGYEWGWADTCCIDKTSSAELSEAINSMYRYYSLADACYAYLGDVPGGDIVSSDEFSSRDRYANHGEAFRGSRWHRRGWTLQELIAPTLLIFLSQDWKTLGSKTDLANVLENITGVPAAVLRLEQEITNFSIAQRMSWAASRETTRLEDEAYCLMGIFGINMPTLYGEGRLAFRRLQEEIMKQSIDTTLFAWGRIVNSADSADRVHQHDSPDSYLFARSPSDFRNCDSISFIPPRSPSSMASRTDIARFENQSSISGETSSAQSVGLPTFSITPYGVHARVPVFYGSPFRRGFIAFLFGGWGYSQQSVGLYLTPCPDAADPSRPLYHCGFGMARTVLISGQSLDRLSFQGNRVTPAWKELYIAHNPPPDAHSTIPRLRINSSLSSPFRFPRGLTTLHYNPVYTLSYFSEMHSLWDGDPPAKFVYDFSTVVCPPGLGTPMLRSGTMVLRLGRCGFPPPRHSGRQALQAPDRRPRAHWADVHFFYSRSPPDELREHSCGRDHIHAWPDYTRTFADRSNGGSLEVTLGFVPWGRSPKKTLVVHFKGQQTDYSEAGAVNHQPEGRGGLPRA